MKIGGQFVGHIEALHPVQNFWRHHRTPIGDSGVGNIAGGDGCVGNDLRGELIGERQVTSGLLRDASTECLDVCGDPVGKSTGILRSAQQRNNPRPVGISPKGSPIEREIIGDAAGLAGDRNRLDKVGQFIKPLRPGPDRLQKKRPILIENRFLAIFLLNIQARRQHTDNGDEGKPDDRQGDGNFDHRESRAVAKG